MLEGCVCGLDAGVKRGPPLLLQLRARSFAPVIALGLFCVARELGYRDLPISQALRLAGSQAEAVSYGFEALPIFPIAVGELKILGIDEGIALRILRTS